ncbi:MAG: arylsulfatase [Tepidisphaeraceae bacterium]
MRTHLVGTTLCAATLSLAASGVAQTAPAPQKPNVVLLVADDLGSGDVGFRGGAIPTPNIDQLARNGVVLDAFYVMPLCSPTRAALLTGRYPFRYGLQAGVVRPWASYGVPTDERMLPEALRDAGYETAIVGKWHLGHSKPEFLPSARGFEHQYGFYNGQLDYYTHLRDGGYDWHRDGHRNDDQGYSTDLIGDEAIRLIRERDKTRPLFMYVAFQAPHSPYQDPPEKYRQTVPGAPPARERYMGKVVGVDAQVGRIVSALSDAGMTSSTLVVFFSDNGGPDPGRITSNGAFRSGKGSVYEGGVRSCASATWPGVIPAGSTATQPIHVVDLFPTVAALAGAAITQKKPLDGRDVLSALRGDTKSTHDEIVVNITPRGGAIRSGDWKLVVNGYRFGNDEAPGNAPASRQKEAGVTVYELFDLSTDKSESKNVAEEHADVVNRLSKRFDELQRSEHLPFNDARPADFKVPAVWGEAEPTTQPHP